MKKRVTLLSYSLLLVFSLFFSSLNSNGCIDWGNGVLTCAAADQYSGCCMRCQPTPIVDCYCIFTGGGLDYCTADLFGSCCGGDGINPH